MSEPPPRRRIPAKWIGVFVFALIVSGCTYGNWATPVEPCAAGHCPDPDTLEYRHGMAALEEANRANAAAAPGHAGTAFIVALLIGAVLVWDPRQKPRD